jgi:hypothetical protein
MVRNRPEHLRCTEIHVMKNNALYSCGSAASLRGLRNCRTLNAIIVVSISLFLCIAPAANAAGRVILHPVATLATSGVISETFALPPSPCIRKQFDDGLLNHAAFEGLNLKSRALVSFDPADHDPKAIEVVQVSLERANMFGSLRGELVAKPGANDLIDAQIPLSDNAPDINTLDKNGRAEMSILIWTMLLIVFVECVRVSRYWSKAPLRYLLIFTVIMMLGRSGLVVFERVQGFLQ